MTAFYSRGLVESLVRSYTKSNQTAQVRIVRTDKPILDGELAEANPVGVVYVGRGRVYTVSGPVQYMLGEEPQYFASTYVSVPDRQENAAADGAYAIDDPVKIAVNDIVEVLSHHDPNTEGRKFRVTDIQGGGQFRPFIVMNVVGVQNAPNWDHPSDVDLVIPPEWIVP